MNVLPDTTMSDPIASVSPAALFGSLTPADIHDFVSDRRREDLTLDFKLAPTAFGNRDERRTLATAISGFANSAGGLLVWGVEAKSDSEGIDCAQRAIPLDNPELFMSRLVAHAGAAVAPIADGVEHRLITGVGGPFAVTYVPESSSGPHMAKLGEDRYYKRSGDRFAMMEHFDLADMFGRRRRPVLRVDIERLAGLSFLVTMRNEGRGIAKAPYLSLELPPGFTCQFGFDGNGTSGLPIMGSGSGRVLFGGNADRVIHVGQTLPITRIGLMHHIRNSPAGSQTIRFEFAAEDFQLTAGEYVFDCYTN